MLCVLVLAAPNGGGRGAIGSGRVISTVPPLGPLEAVLRPYQKQGVAWLQFLRENGFGGILADEMGLGKTLQALAFLRFTREQDPGGLPMLVICPTTLLFTSLAHAQKFTPSPTALSLPG